MWLYLTKPNGQSIKTEVKPKSNTPKDLTSRWGIMPLCDNHRITYRGSDMLELHPEATFFEWGIRDDPGDREAATIHLVKAKQKKSFKPTMVGQRRPSEWPGVEQIAIRPPDKNNWTLPPVAYVHPMHYRKAKQKCLEKIYLLYKKKMRHRNKRRMPTSQELRPLSEQRCNQKVPSGEKKCTRTKFA